MDKIRIDKWLWAVRIYKSRTQASDACDARHIRIKDEPVKASYQVGPGEIITVKKGGFNLQYKVLSIIAQRVGAPVAQACYEDLTPEDETNKYKEWFVTQSASEFREKGTGRPTKRDRRDIDKLKETD